MNKNFKFLAIAGFFLLGFLTIISPALAQAQHEDPVSGTLSVNKTTVNTGENITLTVTGQDNQGVIYIWAHYQNSWHRYVCPHPIGAPATSCTHNFTFSESKSGTYTYYGYVSGKKLSGWSDKGYTTPSSVRVRVNQTSDCHYRYWFDNNHNTACGYKQFCGSYMYQGLRTFSTKTECENALPTIVHEDPVSGTLSVNKTTVNTGEDITLTVTAQDDQGIRETMVSYQGGWHRQYYDGGNSSVEKTFTFSESKPGIYTYYGYVYGKKLNGSNEGAYTKPQTVTVTVTEEGRGTCLDQDGFICKAYEVCQGEILSVNDTNRCCKGKCELPKSFDWRNRHGENWNSPVKSQGSGGTCTYFGPIGAIEAAINLYYNQHLDIDLSEQAMQSCGNTIYQVAIVNQDGTFDYESTPAGDCFDVNNPGDIMCKAKVVGIPDEDCYPYEASNESSVFVCDNLCPNYGKRMWKVTDFFQLLPQEFMMSEQDPLAKRVHQELISEEKLKQTIIKYGPVGVGSIVPGHTANIVGWDVIDGKTQWIYKNSLGIDQGDQGYNRTFRGVDNFVVGYIKTPIIPPPNTNYKIKCVDKDNDGFCNWGISEVKPSSCPSFCKNEEDWDDSDSSIGALGLQTEEKLPDLTITKLEVLRESNNAVTIKYCIKNIGGPGLSSSFFLKYENLNNPTWNFGENRFNGLAPGQEECHYSSKLGVGLTGGNGYVQGENRIRLTIDYYNDVSESNEQNNSREAIFICPGEAQHEDPVSGTLSVNKTTVNTGEDITLTVTAQDDQGIGETMVSYQGGWHRQYYDGGNSSVEKTFTFSESKPGIYTYYGYVYGKKLNGSNEGAYTKPQTVTVTVTESITKKPNLIITSVGFESDKKIHYVIKNTGNALANTSYSTLKIDGMSKSVDDVVSLSAGSSREEFFTWTSCIPGKAYQAKVCANAYGAKINESNTTDNCFSNVSAICPGEAQHEDPVSGTLSVNKTTVNTGEDITLTVTAQDDQGIGETMVSYQGGWHRQYYDGGNSSVEKTFTFSESKPGIYTYYGYVYGKKLNGSNEGAYTKPQTVTVTVTSPIQKSITVTSPNGGERWEAGKAHAIRWTSKQSSLSSRVSIRLLQLTQYSDTPLTAQIITSSTANDGYYSWNIPSTLSLNSEYFIKISDNSDLSVFDQSDNYFSIVSAQAEDPVSGTLSVNKTTVNTGEDITLTVTAQDDQGVNKVRAYYQGSWHYKYCNKATSCTKTFTFQESTPGTKYYYSYVYGYKLNQTIESARTEPYYVKTIVNELIQNKPDLVISNPTFRNDGKLGYIIQNQGNASARYSSSRLYINNDSVATDYVTSLAINNTSNEYFSSWTCKAGTSYNIKVCADTYQQVGESNESNNCTEATLTCPGEKPSITVVSPNGGEEWEVTKNYYITWESKSVPEVNIELVKGNNSWHIANYINASQGSYYWNPGDYPLGSDYKIHIWDADDTSIADYSDDYFGFVAVEEEKPDLVISNPTFRNDGKLGYIIQNQGNASARYSSSRLYINNDSVATDYVTSLAINNTSNEYFSSWTCKAGTSYNIKVCADTYQQVGESNESNNCTEATLTCPGQVIKPTIDSFKVTAVDGYDVVPNIIPYNQRFTISWEASNVTYCIGYSHYVPLVEGGLWSVLKDLPTSGSKELYARHATLGYTSPLTIGLQCFDSREKSVSKEISVQVSAPTCTDSDGGQDYYTKGEVTENTEASGWKDNTFPDMCVTDSSLGNLAEAVCKYRQDGDYYYGSQVYYQCPYGCENGACKIAPQPSVTVLSPSGSTLVQGQQTTITWTTQNYSGLVGLDLYQNDDFIVNIATNISNAGYYIWNVPTTLSGSGFKIKTVLLNTKASSVADFNDIPFSIISAEQEDPVSGTLSVDKTTARVGEKITLTVTGQDDNGLTKIWAYYQGNWHSKYAQGTSFDSTWTFSESKPGTYTYRGYLNGKKANGTMESSYTKPDSVTVIFVQQQSCTDTDGGQDYYKRGTATLGNKNSTDYCKDANTVAEYWCSGMGGVQWIAGPNFHQCPYGCENGACLRETERSIAVESPNGGEEWKIGEKRKIEWSYSSGIPNVNLSLLKLTQYNSTTPLTAQIIATNLSNNGYYYWTIPSNLSTGNRYLIKVSDSSNVNISDQSDSYFSIIKPVTCTDSDGGKDYYVKGSIYETNNAYQYKDYCSNRNTLREFWCTDSGQSDSEYYQCPYGCENGACLREAKKSDLIVSDVSFNSFDGIVDYVIKNQGSASSNNSISQLYVNGSPKITDPVDALSVGDDQYKGFDGWNCSAGVSYTIKACADINNSVSESNESNNCRTETLICPGIAQHEAPVFGTLSVDKTTANIGENITLTVTGQDNQGVSKIMAWYQGAWHTKYCNSSASCTQTFTFSESTSGTKYYYGYVYGKKLNGSNEGAYTKPQTVTVTITSSTVACTDSDGGKNYYTKGKGVGLYGNEKEAGVIWGENPNNCSARWDNSLSYSIHYDCCSSPGSNQLNESYCDANGIMQSVGYQCPYGCKDGACIRKATSTVSSTCTDTDGGLNYYVKGNANPTSSNVDGRVDCCKNSYSTYMGDSVNHIGPGGGACVTSGPYLYEAICGSDGNPTSVVYQCPNGCQNGACVSTSGSIKRQEQASSMVASIQAMIERLLQQIQELKK